MYLQTLVVAIGALAAIASSIPAPSTHVLHESRNHALHSRRSQFTKRSRVHSRAMLPMRIGLTQNNLEKGAEHLMDVSHPESANFGKHWTAEEVARLFAPSDETVKAVTAWLASSGINASRISMSDNRGWLAFDATTEEAEGLLFAEYYEHEKNGRYAVGCDEYYLPKHVQQHVDYIKPGVKPAMLKKRDHALARRAPPTPPRILLPSGDAHKKFNKSDLGVCTPGQTGTSHLTPECIRALYGIPYPDLKHKPIAGNELGIYESLLQRYDQQDLDWTFGNYTDYIPAGTGPLVRSIDGGVAFTPTQTGGGGEVMLDLEVALPIIYPQKIVIYQIDDDYWELQGENDDGAFLDDFLDGIDGSFCTYSAYGQTGNNNSIDPVYPDNTHAGGYNGTLQCGNVNLTNVFSISYDTAEFDLPANYQQRQCNEFMKLGLQGHTIFISSGDYGVAAFPDDDNTDGCLGDGGIIFSPLDAANCPWLTVVGATQLKPGKNITSPHPEEAVGFYGSGGGFSNIYTAPSYQASALSTFFSTANPPYPSYSTANGTILNTGLYNRAGRGYPDVSANGAWLLAYLDGRLSLNGGTSMAAPLFASILNRIVEERLRAGKGPLGFINPTLYANPSAMHDITDGSNPGCGSAGFSAVKGWDPVTGLGTPNYPKLRNVFMALP